MIQDAITIMKKLKFQYLWIDAMCWDSKTDKARELRRIAEIYAFVTIIAAASTGANKGFVAQNKALKADLHIEYGLRNGRWPDTTLRQV